MGHAGTYGTRARIGLIVPPTNTVNESEWRRAMPDDVSFHTHRMAIHTNLQSARGRAALDADLDAAFSMVLPVAPDVVAYACTAGSMVDPVTSLPDALTARHGTPAVTTSAAIVAALDALKVERLVVVTPYTDAMNAHESAFLTGNGFTVAASSGRGFGPPDFTPIARTSLHDVRTQIETTLGEADSPQAIVLLCTDFPTLPLIAEMETRTGLPIVTSNQATLWASLRAAGLNDNIPMLGRLLAC